MFINEINDVQKSTKGTIKDKRKITKLWLINNFVQFNLLILFIKITY